MDNTQVVAYIREQLAKGHTETALRQHLLKHGWSDSAVQDAFTAYHRSVGAKKAAKTRKKSQTNQPSYRDRSLRTAKLKRLKFTATAVVIVALVIGGYVVFGHRKPTPVVATPGKVSDAVLRQGDVNTLAGAIGQYTSDHSGVIPTGISIAPDGTTLVLCGSTCDPTTSGVAQLAAYPSDGVHYTAYAPQLAVPDDKTLYIVPGGKCNGAKGIGAASSNPRAVVILYALNTTAGLVQHCVTL